MLLWLAVSLLLAWAVALASLGGLGVALVRPCAWGRCAMEVHRDIAKLVRTVICDMHYTTSGGPAYVCQKLVCWLVAYVCTWGIVCI